MVGIIICARYTIRIGERTGEKEIHNENQNA
jgi:hypothetical protein